MTEDDNRPLPESLQPDPARIESTTFYMEEVQAAVMRSEMTGRFKPLSTMLEGIEKAIEGGDMVATMVALHWSMLKLREHSTKVIGSGIMQFRPEWADEMERIARLYAEHLNETEREPGT